MAADKKQSSSWKYAKHLYLSITIAAILYLLAIIFSHGRSDLNSLELILRLTIAIPVIGIWFLAARGTIRFKLYATAIKQSRDGEGLNYISDALLWMLLYIIVFVIVTPVSALFKDTAYIQLVTAIANHLPLLLALIASAMFYRGALHLNSIVPLRITAKHSHLLIAVGVFTAILFILYFYNAAPTAVTDNGLPRFVGSVGTLIFTYALPHLIVWGLGLYASLSLFNYSLRVKGTIYKRCFNSLYKGVLLVFICTFVAQIIRASSISLVKFTILLLVIYGLLLLTIYGFTLIYRGSDCLHKIENV